MESENITANDKGAVGEALILDAKRPPASIRRAIEDHIINQYEVFKCDTTPINVSIGGAKYHKVSTESGKVISTVTDGGFSVSWAPKGCDPDMRNGPDGEERIDCRSYTESAYFPAEIKTGEYAELERDQKEALRAIAEADTQQHPMLIMVSIEQLPEQYGVSTRIL